MEPTPASLPSSYGAKWAMLQQQRTKRPFYLEKMFTAPLICRGFNDAISNLWIILSLIWVLHDELLTTIRELTYPNAGY
jgi:hypothetical protein